MMELSLGSEKIWFYSKIVDFRKSINGLVSLISQDLSIRAEEGIFIFCNRHRDKVKVLGWHGNGFVLLYKRLEAGKFTVLVDEDNLTVVLDKQQLSWLLAGLDWDKMRHWDSLSYDEYA